MVEGWYGFPILEGECHKGYYDIYLRDFGGEGGNGFGKRLSWYQGKHHIYGSLLKARHHSLQG